MNEESSLRISFGETALRIRLRAGRGHDGDLSRLVPRFRTANQRMPLIAELEVDDFLANLVVLAEWPTPESVIWDPDIADLARSVVRDATIVGEELQAVSGRVSPDEDELATLLGQRWSGDLTSFQKRDVSKLLRLRHGANFSVPGAGKTRAALALVAAGVESGEIERILVVGPKSCYDAWREEVPLCFNPPLAVNVVDRSPLNGTELAIVNYERLDGLLPTLASWLTDRPSMLILDEAHRMKLGAQGTYGSACLALGPRARKRLILSGTPAPNGVRDLENLMGFVWPGHGRQAVAQAIAGGDLRQASIALKPLFARTTKSELGLTPETTIIRRVMLPALHREIYDALISQMSARAAGSAADFRALGRISMYLLMAATSPALLSVGTTRYEPLEYRVPPLVAPAGTPLFELMRDLPAYELSPKYVEVVRIVAENAQQGRKTLVWSTFVRSLTTLGRMLSQFEPAIVHGGTPDRDDQIKRFRDDDDCFVMLSNPATLGEGISLHHDCHDAIYVDRDFAAGRFLQSLDRIHRLGLPPGVDTRISVLAAEGTIDALVEQRLGDKLEFMGRVLDDPNVERLADLDEDPTIPAALDSDDVKALLGHLGGASS